MRLRILLTATVLTLLSLPGPVSAAPADDCSALKRLDANALKCLKGQAGATVTLSGPIDLAELPPKPGELKNATGGWTVVVPDGTTTGSGGTVLLILAAKRSVGANARITKLSGETVTRLRDDGVCESTLCDLVANQQVSGRDLQSRNLAQNLIILPSPPDGSGTGWADLKWAAEVGFVIVMLGVLGVAYRRRSRLQLAVPSPSSPTTTPAIARSSAATVSAGSSAAGRKVVVPPGPRRTATVRTQLHPQGYVELDRGLVRAIWAEPAEPPPDIGEAVEVVRGTGRDADLLIALPLENVTKATRRHHAP